MHVAITGASSGIGAGLARQFAAEGAKLTLVARREALLRELAGELAVEAHVAAADLGDPTAATGWLEAAEAALGPIDVLINNAGRQIVGPTAQVDPEDGERLLRLNLHTPLRLIRAVLPAMQGRRAGSIVNVASMAALAPTAGMTYYNASKGGLAAASEALRSELRGSGVNVLTVYPGIISETDMGAYGLSRYQPSTLLGLQPHGSCEALAYLVARAVERRSPRVIYPRVNAMARWFPTTTRFLLDRFTPPLREG